MGLCWDNKYYLILALRSQVLDNLRDTFCRRALGDCGRWGTFSPLAPVPGPELKMWSCHFFSSSWRSMYYQIYDSRVSIACRIREREDFRRLAGTSPHLSWKAPNCSWHRLVWHVCKWDSYTLLLLLNWSDGAMGTPGTTDIAKTTTPRDPVSCPTAEIGPSRRRKPLGTNLARVSIVQARVLGTNLARVSIVQARVFEHRWIALPDVAVRHRP